MSNFAWIPFIVAVLGALEFRLFANYYYNYCFFGGGDNDSGSSGGEKAELEHQLFSKGST